MSLVIVHRTPNTPYGQPNQYKVNVNRQKTRKWVEAKTQNYDGDDWGGMDDEFDDDDGHDNGSAGGRQDYFSQPPQAQRPGRLTAGLRAISSSGPPTPGSGSAGSSSPSLRPSERIALEKQAAGNRSASGPPALHIQTLAKTPTEPPPPPPPQVAGPPGPMGASSSPFSPFPPRKSSMTSQDRPELTSPDARPPRTSSRSESPASAARSPGPATGPPRFIRPSEIYKRMEEEKEKERRSMESAGRPSLDSTGGPSSEDGSGDATTGSARRRPSFGSGRNDEGDANHSLRPLEPVAERKSEYGFDGLMINPAEPAPPNPATLPTQLPTPNQPSQFQPQPQPPEPELHHPRATSVTDAPAEPVKRYSTSPKLPLLSRLSGFGGDFFSGGPDIMSDSPKSSDPPANASQAAANGGQSSKQQTESLGSNQAKPFRPSFPGAWVSETATTPGDMATPGIGIDIGIGIGTGTGTGTGAGTNTADAPGDEPGSTSERPEDAHLRPAPLRTPSPSSASAFSAHDDQQQQQQQHLTGSGRASPANHHYLKATAHRSADTLAERDTEDNTGPRRDMTPIAPLQPRKKSFVVEGDAPPPQPSNPITRVDTVSTADNASPLKESDVLRDEIMRSLSPVRPSDGPSESPRDGSAARESAYLSDVYGDYWSGDDKATEAEAAPADKDEAADATPRPPAHPTFEPVMTDAAPPAVPAAAPEAARPEPRRERFSWEAGSISGGLSPTQASPTKQPTAESAENLTSPISAARHGDSTGPSGDGRSSPLLSFPTMNFGDSDISSKLVSAVSTLPPDHGNPITGDTQSPPSNTTGGQDAFSPPPDSANKHLYLTEDKILVQSTMSSLSPMEPTPIADDEEPQRTTSPPQREPPEGVPLPRSPSPTQQPGPGSGGRINENRQSQTAYNMMTLKQILQLPSPSDRVQKMQETREHMTALETGLASWLAEMSAQPAHENAMASYGYALSGDDAELWGTKGGAVRIPLNAPAPGAEGPGEDGSAAPPVVGRTASTSINMGNLVMHSGQAGAKGKELLHSAGKMGKGLLSKGKNKLRERAESKRA
ncbi:hypothetical protein DHEL01_v204459 [Diaporthe helianthi]|uniref:Uncharacterized protein n=1 Tax=Diaporthe helianthi TaxID=158607 RepID=A0A2P5I3Q7_DIAHE|nr:hypothetical protein DHEL01_v204459 [Diaporthe helianthi]